MSESKRSPRTEAEVLIQRYVEGGINPEEASQLWTLLQNEPALGDQLLDHLRLDLMLRELSQADALSFETIEGVAAAVEGHERATIIPFPEDVTPTRHRWTRGLAWGAAVAACLAVLVTVGGLAWKEWSGSREAMPVGVAVLTRAVGVEWDVPGQSPRVGVGLQPGWIEWSAGALQIEFARGARIVIEGPAEFQIVSDNEGYLRRGRLWARVPQSAKGFQVGLPGYTVIDHGTEFGCKVLDADAVEVHVFTGNVELAPTNSTLVARELHVHQAVRIESGTIRTIDVTARGFLGEEELARRDSAQSRERLAAWRTSLRMGQLPSALVYFDFERSNRWDRTLINRVTSAGAGSEASIVGCDWVQGRWAGKGAVEFKRPSDRLRLHVPGRFESLTFLAWVRVDRLPNNQNALVMTDSFKNGETHWYLYNDGRLGLGVHRVSADGNADHWWYAHSDPILTPGTLGTWLFLASVFDGATGEARHYCNGQFVGSGQLNRPMPLRLDTFEVGNWALRPGDARLSSLPRVPVNSLVRNFHGRMDELAIVGSALTEAEVQEFFQWGRVMDEQTLTRR